MRGGSWGSVRHDCNGEGGKLRLAVRGGDVETALLSFPLLRGGEGAEG
jgi:hypothetical protein